MIRQVYIIQLFHNPKHVSGVEASNDQVHFKSVEGNSTEHSNFYPAFEQADQRIRRGDGFSKTDQTIACKAPQKTLSSKEQWILCR